MRTDQARTMTSGAAVYYKNLINLKRYAATVGTSTPQQLNITVTTGSQAMSFPLSSNDNAAEIPVDALS
ncbi:MAG TPA: hypothetical protein VKC60_03480 [Opitutaceae bacterium]|nr:hypothetical protein [Opitutaceae bacterium]